MQNCIDKAAACYPAAFHEVASADLNELELGFAQPRFVFYEKAERDSALSDCSRWPW